MIILIGICLIILMQVLIIRSSIRQHRYQQQGMEAHSRHLATHQKWLSKLHERVCALEAARREQL
jgi:hypothetical protein